MAINVTQLKDELGAYHRTHNKEIRAMVYQKSKTAKFMRTITSIKGRFPALQSITGRVVQGFTSAWTPLGVTKFVPNELKNYQQKVNFPIKADAVQNTWIADLYDEQKKPADMPISKYIIDKELMPAVVRDREWLLGKSVYDATKLDEFGKSMNGIAEIIRLGILSTTSPMYQIPIATITMANVVDQVNDFELKFPEEIKEFVDKIYMSQTYVEQYALNFFKTYGVYPTYTPEGGLKTIVGTRQLIGLPSLNGTNIIFTTPDENFLRLIDLNDEPVITDIQALDYDVKIFMEWWEGVAFWTNQLVVVGVFEGLVEGLAPAGANAEYYGKPAVVKVP